VMYLFTYIRVVWCCRGSSAFEDQLMVLAYISFLPHAYQTIHPSIHNLPTSTSPNSTT
jgi:hypothetical protein